jgi:hypothetical protein
MKGQIGLEDIIGLVVGLGLFIALYPTMASSITYLTGLDPITGSLITLIPAAMVVWLIVLAFKKALGMKTNEERLQY